MTRAIFVIRTVLVAMLRIGIQPRRWTLRFSLIEEAEPRGSREAYSSAIG